ncbi:DUF3575 domain-containing protein [Chryseobacterium sp. HSC-36S06]|uniref:DUF3575 domain-containing protein n=1 Tax=Chryseobacterium sp. HSC-36S06 TaxID=2910970 RepID=UPI00209FE1AA|nr:DUF3575 domain-containing protein [Chryseobacterium sp. HSC-36S06]MCP2037738.1 opacity protein-like surface antigen [Chryseobacterium sp. HSC-36S06]
MKKLFLAFAFSILSFTQAQQQDSTSKKLYVKANAVFLPVGVLNAGLEYQLSKKMTLQGEVFISPWKSFAGKYAQVYMVGADTRYYFTEAFKHWYVGANLSFARYKIQKWNYWKDIPSQFSPESPIYSMEDLYQDGFSFFLGAVIGYQFKLNENLNMDIFLGGGIAQSYYKGFHKYLGVRYDTDPDRTYNQSGEWIPYKGGIMISYKLK